MPEDPALTTEEEINLQEQLLAEQQFYQAQQQINRLAREAVKLGPSLLKYSFLGVVAIMVDVVDGADLTLVGIAISKVVSLVGTGIIYFTLWLTNGKVKRASEMTAHLEEALLHAQQAVARASRVAMRASRLLKRYAITRNLGRQLGRSLVKIRRAARRNPLTKILIGGAINLVPWLAIINLLTIWVILAYWDEKKLLKEAAESAQEAKKPVAGLTTVIGQLATMTGNAKKPEQTASSASSTATVSSQSTSSKASSLPATTDDITAPEAKARTKPTTQESESEKLRKMRGADSAPAWQHDQKAGEAAKLRQQRLEVAERMGLSSEEATRRVLDIEKEEEIQ